MMTLVTPAVSAAVTVGSIGTRFKICRETILEHNADDGDKGAKAGDEEKHGNLFVRHRVPSSISTITYPIDVAMAVVPRLNRGWPAVSRAVSGRNRTSLRCPEKDKTYDDGNRRQHAKSDNRIVHAMKPSTGAPARMARR
jgi:hypothetical protein